MNTCATSCLETSIPLSAEEKTETTVQMRVLSKIRAKLQKLWRWYEDSLMRGAQIEARIAEIKTENDRNIYYFRGL